VGVDGHRHGLSYRAEAVILLDTNALIWLDRSSARTRGLERVHMPLYVSPATLAGTSRRRAGVTLDQAIAVRRSVVVAL
jgi:hypothetical protein